MQFNIEAEHNIRPSNCILCKCFRETVKFTFRQLLECTLEHCLQWRKRKRNSLNQQRVHEWIVVFLCNGIPSIEESSMCNNVGEPQGIILSEKSKLWNNIQNDTIYVKFIIMWNNPKYFVKIFIYCIKNIKTCTDMMNVPVKRLLLGREGSVAAAKGVYLCL